MKSLAKRAAAACLALMMVLGAYTAAMPVGNFGSAGIVTAGAAEAEKELAASNYAQLKGGLAIGKRYKVNAYMMKYDDKNSASMADAAIDRQVTVEYKDGQLYVTVKFNPLTALNQTAYLSWLKYYTDSEVKESEVLTTYDTIDQYNGKAKDSDGNWISSRYSYPETMRFPVDDGINKLDPEQYVKLQVFVPVMDAIQSGAGTQDVYMKLDWTTAEEIVVEKEVKEYDPSVVREKRIVLPFIPAEGSSLTTYSTINPNEVPDGEEITQLADGIYKVGVHMYMDYGYSGLDIGGRDRSIDNTMTLVVLDGKYYIRTNIYAWNSSKNRYYSRIFYYTQYEFQGTTSSHYGPVNTDYEEVNVVSYYDIVNDENENTVYGWDEEDYREDLEVKYPSDIYLPITDGKITNTLQYYPVRTGTLSKTSDSSVYGENQNTYYLGIDWTTAELVEDLSYTAADYTAVDAAIASIPEDMSIYTESSAQAVQAAVDEVIRGYDDSKQAKVDAMAENISKAVAALKVKPADYTEVDKALANADKLSAQLFKYTDETVKALDDAVDGVVRDLDITDQSKVDAMAKAINDAIAALEYKPADYSKVDEALAAVPEDMSGYTEESVKAVNDAVAAVERDLDITDQSKVDAMAKAINDAVAALEKKTQPGPRLEDGKYTVSAEMIKLDRTNKSMSNNAIDHTLEIEVKDGEYYAIVTFKGMSVLGQTGYLKSLGYYDAGYTYNKNGKPVGTVIPAEVLSVYDAVDQYNDKDNPYPEKLKFKLVDKTSAEYVPLQVFVPVMEAIAEGTGTQDVLMKIDWSTVQKQEEQPETKRLNGDVDNTGKVDTKDAMKIIAFAKKTHTPKDDEEFKYADVNHDGVIDSKDAMMVVAHVKGTKKLPD